MSSPLRRVSLTTRRRPLPQAAAPFGPRRRPRRRTLTMAVLAAVVAGFLAAPAQAVPPPAAERSGLQNALSDLADLPGGPPGAIAVVRRGDRMETFRAGVAEVGTDRIPQIGDSIRLASVSKAFGGVVALALVDRGQLSLDDTIGRRLPSLPAAWGCVTLRELLNHTSGLPDYVSSPRFQSEFAAHPHHVFDSRHLLDYVADRPLLFTPGSAYHYSNSDNIAVALMTEAVTGRRYEDLLRTDVLEPLGLNRTSLPQGSRLQRPYLHGYVVNPPARPTDVSTAFGMSGLWAAGGMVSTPRDLNRFIAADAGGELLSPATHEQQFRFMDGRSQPSGPGRNEAGLAIFRYTTPCGVVYGHTGNVQGYTQFAAATADGSRSVTLSLSEQLSDNSAAPLVSRFRAVEEQLVCRAMKN